MPRTEIDPDDREPVYRQLAAILRAQIESGEIPPRRALPSKRMLVQRYQVSTRTIDSAMAVLRSEGLIATEAGKGLFVTDRSEWKSGGQYLFTRGTASQAAGMTLPADGAWRKSSLSFSNSNCVEVAALPDGTVGMRDSKAHGAGPALAFDRADWESFIASVKAAE